MLSCTEHFYDFFKQSSGKQRVKIVIMNFFLKYILAKKKVLKKQYVFAIIFVLISRQTLIFHSNLSRSNRPDVFCKKAILKNLAKFTRKHL